MHQGIVIVHMDRLSDGISTIPDNQNNLALQSFNTNYPPQDPTPWHHYMESCLYTA